MMFDFLKEYFSNEMNEKSNLSTEQKIKIATCSLFLEIAKSDDDFSDVEFDAIINIMKDFFGINPDEAKELIEISETAVKRSVGLYEFTETISNYFDDDQKYDILKNLWRLVFIDNVLSKYEDHMIRIISTNLKLSHRDFIAAKLEVKAELAGEE